MRWDSRELAGIGIVGALLSPVLVDAGTSGIALAFLAIALVSATGVLLWKRWDWLAAAAFVTSAPQLVAWLADSYDDSLALALVVLSAFWVLYAVAALGYELRDRTESLRFSSASLLLADAILTAGAGWLMLDQSDHSDAATGWVIGVALVHVTLGAATLRGRISREVSLLLLAVGIGLSAIGAALALDGPALVAAWSVEAVLLAWLGAPDGAGPRLRRGRRLPGGARRRTHSPSTHGRTSSRSLRSGRRSSRSCWSAPRPRPSPGSTEARGPSSRDALDLLALAGLAYLVPIAFEGVPVVVGWAVLAVALAFLTKRGLVELGGIAPALFVGLAAAHTLLIEAPPTARAPGRRRRSRQRLPGRRGHDGRGVRRGAALTGPARQAAHADRAPSERSMRLPS